MLQVSSNAAAALEEARNAQEVPQNYGVRIYGEPDEQGQVGIGLAFSEAPEDGDQVTEQAGTEIYIDPQVAEPLADSMIDLEQTDEGPQLVLKPQGEAG